MNSIILTTPCAVTGGVIFPRDIEVSLVKETSGLGAPRISLFEIPIRTRVSRKIKSTELPVSMRTRCTLQFAISNLITRASSCGLSKSLVSSSEKEISGQSTQLAFGFFATGVNVLLSCCLIALIESRKQFRSSHNYFDHFLRTLIGFRSGFAFLLFVRG